jgi:hypothetical protein
MLKSTAQLKEERRNQDDAEDRKRRDGGVQQLYLNYKF